MQNQDYQPKQPDTAAGNGTEAPAAPAGGSGGIVLCGDGTYRWYYEYPMMKKPGILFTIWKVLFIASLVPVLVEVIAAVSDGDGFLYGLGQAGVTFGIVFGILFVLSLLAYLIVAASYGFRYIVLFEMSETSIAHIQANRQFKKAQAIGWLTAFAGLAGNDFAAAGTGMLAATKQAVVSEFAQVTSVIGQSGSQTIYVNQELLKNQVYTDPDDYDFVWNYITSRCPKAKIKPKE